MAVFAIDFPDQPFAITQPRESDPLGNPQIAPVSREEVSQFYADFFMTPSEVNHGGATRSSSAWACARRTPGLSLPMML